jgi:hypothetical protein
MFCEVGFLLATTSPPKRMVRSHKPHAQRQPLGHSNNRNRNGTNRNNNQKTEKYRENIEK